MASKDQSARLEQRTLTLSLAAVAAISLGSLAWGLAIESDVVILNGIFSLVSLVGSVLYLTAAKLVSRPADRRFQYGYAHVEPLVNGVNALLVLVICIYALVNGIEGLRSGGDALDADSVLVMVLALLFLPVPIGVLRRNVGELLHMGSEDDAITGRVETTMQAIRSEHDIRSHSTHVAKVGRSHLVEVNSLRWAG